MNCEKCGKEHDGSFGSGRFCSSYCARSFSTQKSRKEINLKVSQTMKSSEKLQAYLAKRRGKTNIEIYGQEKALEIKNKTVSKFKSKMGEDYPFVYGSDTSCVKLELLKTVTSCCNCGLNEWQNKFINLELHHIDGDNQNNARNNLVLLCPNCHSQTDNFRNKNTRTKVAEDVLVTALKETKLNMRQALLKVRLAAKGKNYERCKMLITKYKLDMES